MKVNFNSYTTADLSVKNSKPHFGNSLLIFKPGMTQETNKRMEKFLKLNGFDIVSDQTGYADTDTLKQHYEEHKDKKMFPALINYIKSGEVRVMEVSKKSSQDDAAELRKLVKEVMRPWFKFLQPTNTKEFYFTNDNGEQQAIIQNGIHVSADKEAAKREIKIWNNQF